MSTTITVGFITQYTADVHEVFQRRGSYLMPAVFHKSGVIGSTASFHKIGTGVATTKARHGTITPMNQSHTAPTTTLADFYAGLFESEARHHTTYVRLAKLFSSDDEVDVRLDGLAAAEAAIIARGDELPRMHS